MGLSGRLIVLLKDVRHFGLWVPLTLLALFRIDSLPASGATCDSLSQLTIPQTTIMSAQSFEPGAFVPPGPADPRGAARFKSIPAFCRVQAAVETEANNVNSRIQMEVWLPISSAWNHKFRGGRQRWFCRFHQLRWVRWLSIGRLCSCEHRHWPPGGGDRCRVGA